MKSTQTQIGFSNLNINRCFQNHYIVPDYQREYVWNHVEVEQLLSDLMEAFQTDSKKDYFLGTIVTYKTDGYFELIDGQQRLTTFYLLLCALRRLYAMNNEATTVVDNLIYSPVMNEDGDTVPSFHLQLQYEDASNYLEVIYNGKSVPPALSASGTKLFGAFQTILDFFASQLPNFSDVKKFSYFVLNKTCFIQIETYDITDALKIFETINQRGVGLNPMDLLKNMIFRQVDRAKFKELNMKWKEITTALEKINEKPLRFLRYFIMSNYDTSSQKDGILREDQIYTWLTNNNDQCQYEEHPFEFVNLMKVNVDRYTAYLTPPDDSNGNIHLINIPLLAGRSYKLHLLLLLAAGHLEQSALPRFKKVVESAVYYSVINRIPTNQTERTFIGWCAGIRNLRTEEELEKFVAESMIPVISDWKKTHKQYFLMLGLHSMQQYRVKFIMAKIFAYIDALRLGESDPGNLASYMASEPYKLNVEAFRQHSSNFRKDALREFFVQVGVDNVQEDITKDSQLTGFIRKTMGEDESEEKLPFSKYFEMLDDLIERRNVVAHGSEVDDLLSYDYLDEYAEYISLLMPPIYEALLYAYYYATIKANAINVLGAPIKVFNNSIVCINSSQYGIKVGDTLIGMNSRGEIQWGAIQSIEIDGERVQEVSPLQAANIGMVVPFKAKDNYIYYHHPEGNP